MIFLGFGMVLLTPAMAQNGNAARADKSFVKAAMQGNNAEIQLGQMASQKGSTDAIKQFGQKMVHDHTQLNEDMQPLAQQLGVTPPQNLSPAQKAIKLKLDGINGKAFDKAYIKAMVRAHTKTLALFQQEAQSAQSPAVKQAAAKGEKKIADHLQLAEQTAREVGVLPNRKRVNDSTITK